MSELIQVRIHAGFRVIALNRPDKMNALTPGLIGELMAALGAAEADPACRALVLTGSGRAFCAGADLACIAPRDDLGAAIEASWNPLARKLNALRIPTIAAVGGVAAGAGANLALGCDIVLAGRSASFIQAFSKIGLIPDAGGTWQLPRLVGIGRARALAMLAEPVNAERAEAIGMIYRVVDDASLMAEAEALAARLAAMPTQALLLTRELFAASSSNTLDQQLDLERDLQRWAGHTPDFAEGVAAFLEKRKPVFSGRAE
jgi:2-(1,2-epoxy-1,2-dihydrophenyl)acetyl-CoA isomerase